MESVNVRTDIATSKLHPLPASSLPPSTTETDSQSTTSNRLLDLTWNSISLKRLRTLDYRIDATGSSHSLELVLPNLNAP